MHLFYASFPPPRTVRAHAAARAEPRNAEPLVRAVHQRRRHGAERNAPVSQEVRDDAAVQANLGEIDHTRENKHTHTHPHSHTCLYLESTKPPIQIVSGH